MDCNPLCGMSKYLDAHPNCPVQMQEKRTDPNSPPIIFLERRKRRQSLQQQVAIPGRPMRMSMNTTSTGSGGVDDIQSHPQGGFRGQTKLVKIRRTSYSRRTKVSEEEALKVGLEQKAKEFKDSASEVYAQA